MGSYESPISSLGPNFDSEVLQKKGANDAAAILSKLPNPFKSEIQNTSNSLILNRKSSPFHSNEGLQNRSSSLLSDTSNFSNESSSSNSYARGRPFPASASTPTPSYNHSGSFRNQNNDWRSGRWGTFKHCNKNQEWSSPQGANLRQNSPFYSNEDLQDRSSTQLSDTSNFSNESSSSNSYAGEGPFPTFTSTPSYNRSASFRNQNNQWRSPSWGTSKHCNQNQEWGSPQRANFRRNNQDERYFQAEGDRSSYNDDDRRNNTLDRNEYKYRSNDQLNNDIGSNSQYTFDCRTEHNTSDTKLFKNRKTRSYYHPRMLEDPWKELFEKERLKLEEDEKQMKQGTLSTKLQLPSYKNIKEETLDEEKQRIQGKLGTKLQLPCCEHNKIDEEILEEMQPIQGNQSTKLQWPS